MPELKVHYAFMLPFVQPANLALNTLDAMLYLEQTVAGGITGVRDATVSKPA